MKRGGQSIGVYGGKSGHMKVGRAHVVNALEVRWWILKWRQHLMGGR